MTRYGSGLTVLFLGVVAITASGCKPKVTYYPVEGTVTRGGRPLRDVEVIFLADAGTVGPRAIGRTDKAGRYRLQTDHGEVGVVAGKHRVLVLDLEAAKKQFLRSLRGQQLVPDKATRLDDQSKTAADGPRVPPSYGSINDTPLRAEVGPTAQVFDIAIP
jgi:hypothetical protein